MPLPAYALLGAAIVAEVIGTSALKASEGFTRPLPAVITAVAYLAAFYALSLTLKTVPLGIAYGVWSGVGIVLVSAVGWWVYDQHLDAAALAGMALILAGVLVIHLFSGSTGH
jgi:small multidrug resistance pump